MKGVGSPPIVLRGLAKRYGATRALQGLDLHIAPGEVLGVAGPNGAGKSTLMRVLAGEEDLDAGTVSVGGRPFTARDLGTHVAVVHQEPQLFPNMTVADNLLVGREGRLFRRPAPGATERDLMAVLALEGRAGRAVADCSLAMRQRVEIARALARQAGAFLFDEPNSALEAAESEALFAEMHRLAAAGNAVLLVTHRLDDLVRHCRRVVVVRDGRLAAELTGDALTEEAIAHLLVQGLEPASATRPPLAAAGPLPEVGSDTAAAPSPGRIVALLGVEGSGAREHLRSFAGLAEDVAPGRARPRSIAYVAPSRTDSLFAHLTVGDNAVARLGRRDIASGLGVLSRGRMRRIAGQAIARFRIKTRSADDPITALSGGNQQKVAIAQALLTRPGLVLLEEPTRGVDVGSKRDIYALLRETAANGTAVMIFCTEMLEAYEVADRACVFQAGRPGACVQPGAFPSIEAFASAVALAAGGSVSDAR